MKKKEKNRMIKDEIISMLMAENKKLREETCRLSNELYEAHKEICNMAPYYVLSQVFLPKKEK